MQGRERILASQLTSALNSFPLIFLGGPPYIGKKYLIQSIFRPEQIQILRLDHPDNLHWLDDLDHFLLADRRVHLVIDQIHRMPELIPKLCQILKNDLGSQQASILLMGPIQPRKLHGTLDLFGIQFHELELTPLLLVEIGSTADKQNLHWLRGGFPKSFLSETDQDSFLWRNELIDTILERDLPRRGVTASPIQLRRMCQMMAQQQGGTLNYRQMGLSLGLDGKTVTQYLKHLEHHYLIRSLPAWNRETGKRMVKTPKTYWRDSGILHALLNIKTLEQLLSNPLCGQSWKGYCVEQILSLIPHGFKAFHYQTHAGAEVDLVLEGPTGALHAVAISRNPAPRLTPAFRESMQTLGAGSGTYLMPEGNAHFLSDTVQAMPLLQFLQSIPS